MESQIKHAIVVKVMGRTGSRGQLKNRMNTIAPNLTTLVGELVGARFIAHGGSLLNFGYLQMKTQKAMQSIQESLLTMRRSRIWVVTLGN
nr:putative nucleolar protein 5-2 [Ipomoea trifida]